MIKRVFRQMTATQIASSVTYTVCLLIDSIVIGRMLGVEAMSAYGLANPLIIIFAALGTMTGCGVQVMTGEVMGKGDKEGCRRVCSTAVVMSLILSAIWIVVVFLAAIPICHLLSAGGSSTSARVLTMTSDYLRGYILGAPFYFFSQIMVPWLQAMGRRKLTLLTVGAMTLADVIFDLLSVYVFHAGMFGIGLASGCSFLAATLVGLVYFLRKDCPFKFSLKAINRRMALDITHGGSPIIVNQFFFMIRMYVINQILLITSGTVAIAVFSVICTVGNIIYSIGLGAGSITLMLSSIFYSEEDRSSIKELISVMVPHSLQLIIAAAGLVILAARPLIRLFLGGDLSILAIAVPALRIYILSLIPCVITTVFKNYYQGTRRMTYTNVISFMDNTAFLLPITWLFSRIMGLTGIWIGIVVANICTVLFIAAVAWIKAGKIAFTADAFGLLKPGFGADPDDVLELTVTDKDSAVSGSQQICDFCMDKGLGKKVSLMTGLCMEEIVMNTIDFGFSADERPHSADVRLVVDGSKCILRVRDNCINFDPTDYMNLHQDSDPTAHIGLRMVMKLVSEVNYNNSLGLNNLYMRFEA